MHSASTIGNFPKNATGSAQAQLATSRGDATDSAETSTTTDSAETPGMKSSFMSTQQLQTRPNLRYQKYEN